MQIDPDAIAQCVAELRVSHSVQEGVKEFVSKVIDSFSRDLISVVAFGSAVTGDYDSESDVNLLIVYGDMEVVELARVAELSRRWLRKHKFAPRFLSSKNLRESEEYFQVDFLSMRDAHVLLWGKDVLSEVAIHPENLRWQIAYEIKAMRMRIKQQYWRSIDDPKMMRNVLASRLTSTIHLMRSMLLLKGLPAPLKRREVIDAAASHFGIDSTCAIRLLELRHVTSPRPSELNRLFIGLMEIIRKIDTIVDEVQS
jgi:predicted nucleotidyltransferase